MHAYFFLRGSHCSAMYIVLLFTWTRVKYIEPSGRHEQHKYNSKTEQNPFKFLQT